MLLLAAFLLLPIFLSLFALFVLEIRVLETISISFAKIKIWPFTFLRKIKYLPTLQQTVKATITIITLGAFCSNLRAFSTGETLLIAKGEHKEWKFPELKSFTVGNPQVISYKHNAKSKKLLIKGKKLGFTELIVWKQNRSKVLYHIYVLSKSKHLKILHLAQALKSTGLKINPLGPLLFVKGNIHSLSTYKLLHKLKKKHHELLHFDVSLSKKLKSAIIKDIEKHFFRYNIFSVECDFESLHLNCFIPDIGNKKLSFIKNLKDKYFLSLSSVSSWSQKNILVKIKLIQVENTEGKEFNLGLDQLKGGLNNVIEYGPKALTEENQIFLRNNHLQISTLAEPEFLTIVGRKSLIEIGSDIPFPITTNNQVQTDFRFAGLKIDFQLIPYLSGLALDYRIEFTRPSGNGQISGNREKSFLLVTKKTPLQLFQIGFQAQGTQKTALPFLGSIPLIGYLFRSSSKQTSYKQITAYLTLEEVSKYD